MAKGAYIGVPSYKVIIERNMTHSSGSTWTWGTNTANEVNWTKGKTYVCDVTIDGVTYPNITFSPDVGSSWFAVYPETGDAVFEVYVATNNQLYDYGLGLDTTTSHTILLSTGNFNGVARKIKKGYVGIPTLMNVPTGRSKYNNMDLPTVPEWNSTTYPYAYISYSSNEGYRFLVCSAKLQYVLAQGKCTPVSNASYMYVTLWNRTTGTWDSWSSVKSATANSTYFTSPTWANTAIPYSDNSNTLISATEPTVLYEEKEVGIARKIKKAYIGIGGVARPCWSGGELAYYGQITDLSSANYYQAGGSIGNYALFAGGYTNGQYTTVVEAYDKSLTRSNPTSLAQKRYQLAATAIGGYVLFGGGSSEGSNKSNVDAFDASLTRKTSSLTVARAMLGATTVGGYALFGPASGKSNVDAFDSSLTRTSAPTAVQTNGLTGTTVGNYALFGSHASSTLDVYDGSLTHSTNSLDNSGLQGLCAGRVGNYALFSGGNKNGTMKGTVEVFNTSLAKTYASDLSTPRYNHKSATIGDYLIFAGGTTGAWSTIAPSKVVDAYDASLIRTIQPSLCTARYHHSAATVGDYAIFAGGGNDGGSVYVDAFVVA